MAYSLRSNQRANFHFCFLFDKGIDIINISINAWSSLCIWIIISQKKSQGNIDVRAPPGPPIQKYLCWKGRKRSLRRHNPTLVWQRPCYEYKDVVPFILNILKYRPVNWACSSRTGACPPPGELAPSFVGRTRPVLWSPGISPTTFNACCAWGRFCACLVAKILLYLQNTALTWFAMDSRWY